MRGPSSRALVDRERVQRQQQYAVDHPEPDEGSEDRVLRVQIVAMSRAAEMEHKVRPARARARTLPYRHTALRTFFLTLLVFWVRLYSWARFNHMDEAAPPCPPLHEASWSARPGPVEAVHDSTPVVT